MQKHSLVKWPYCGLVITENPDLLFKLGRDETPDLAPKLKYCRVRVNTTISKKAEASFDDSTRLGKTGLYLDGSWKLPKRAKGLRASFRLTISNEGGHVASNVKNYQIKKHGLLTKDTVSKFDGTPRLGEAGRCLDGKWRIYVSQRFKARLDMKMAASSHCLFDSSPKIGQPGLFVDGTWNVPAFHAMSASCEIKVSK